MNDQSPLLNGSEGSILRSFANSEFRRTFWKYVATSVILVITFAFVIDFRKVQFFSTKYDLQLDGRPLSAFLARRVGYDQLPYFGSNASTTKTYKFLKSYDFVIEPYAPMTLEYMDGSGVSFDDFRYTILSENDETLVTGTGSNEFKIECAPHDELTVEIEMFSETENSWSNYRNLKALCIYVRREIRELSADDLNSAINAMYQIWAVNETEGSRLYGENFHSIDWFVGMHDFNAAWKDADHFHEGLGFLPQHVKSTNLFESAMQSVDPSVSLFYWDFTIESANDISMFDSPMFHDDTFGSLRAPADDYWGWTYRNDSVYAATIKNGLWKKSTSLHNPYSSLSDSFGYMRSPWNMNPVPYITRFSKSDASLPGCSTYYNWLEESDFSEFMKDSAYAPHGSTHGSIGGIYGCDMLDEMRLGGYIETTDDQISLCAKWGFYIKELYRAEYVIPRTDCTATYPLDESSIDCGFICNDDLSEDMLTFMSDELTISKILGKDFSREDWMVWRDFICEGNGYRIFVGDHLESASPIDPSFWPIHPTQLKMIAGGFNEFVWPTSASEKGSNTYLCNHGSCYPYDSYGGEKDFYDFCCYGHYEYDQMLDFVSGNRSQVFGLTNREILDATDASSDTYKVNYIYNHFEWSHCSQDFDGLVSELQRAMSS